MIKNILKKKIKFKNKGFTLAEILVTLSIIGIIAAILFPSILANYTERTLNAKRQALIARMSQAMGELADSFATYEDTDNPEENSALKFINEGLSKVYKIAAACDYATLASCDIPKTITKLDGTTYDLIGNASDFFKYAPYTIGSYYMDNNVTSMYGWEYSTASAGFMTKNGESVLLFFYPRCKSKPTGGFIHDYASYVTSTCVNMIYDLNGGKQKPNRINEDIGFMTVLYANTPYVVSPKIVNYLPYSITGGTGTTNPTYTLVQANYAQAKSACSAMGENVRLPSYEELGAIGMNYPLSLDADIYKSTVGSTHMYWTSTRYNATSNIVAEIPRGYDAVDVEIYDTSNQNTLIQYLCVQD